MNAVYRMGLDNNGGTTKIIAQHRSGGTYENIEGSTLSDALGAGVGTMLFLLLMIHRIV